MILRHGVFICVLGVLLEACASVKAPVPSSPVFYPEAPAEPRVQFLMAISSSRDLSRSSGRRSFADFILGKQPRAQKIIKPYGVAYANGTFYVCDTIARTIWVVDLHQGTFLPFKAAMGAGRLIKPINIAIDPDGTKYVADSGRQQILVYDQHDRFLRALGMKEEVLPVDVLIAGDRLYVCDMQDNEIEIWEKETGKRIGGFGQTGSDPGDLFRPTNITQDAEENVYVSDSGNFRIQKFTLVGEHLATIGGYGIAFGNFVRPKGVAVDRAGRIYEVDAAFENVQIFDQAGNLLLFFGGTGQEPGSLVLPSQVIVINEDLAHFQRYAAPNFALEHVIVVTSQYGPNKLNIYGFGHVQ